MVTCNVEGRDVESFAAEAERRVQGLALPRGVSSALTGERNCPLTADIWLPRRSSAKAGLLTYDR